MSEYENLYGMTFGVVIVTIRLLSFPYKLAFRQAPVVTQCQLSKWLSQTTYIHINTYIPLNKLLSKLILSDMSISRTRTSLLNYGRSKKNQFSISKVNKTYQGFNLITLTIE